MIKVKGTRNKKISKKDPDPHWNCSITVYGMVTAEFQWNVEKNREK